MPRVGVYVGQGVCVCVWCLCVHGDVSVFVGGYVSAIKVDYGLRTCKVHRSENLREICRCMCGEFAVMVEVGSNLLGRILCRDYADTCMCIT